MYQHINIRTIYTFTSIFIKIELYQNKNILRIKKFQEKLSVRVVNYGIGT